MKPNESSDASRRDIKGGNFPYTVENKISMFLVNDARPAKTVFKKERKKNEKHDSLFSKYK